MSNILKSIPPKIQLNQITLSFKGECQVLEQAFINDYNTKSLNHIRISLFLGLILYAVFGFLDVSLVPEQKTQLWFIRYAVVCPCILIIILLSLISGFKKYMQACLVFLMILAGSGISIMVAIANPPANYSYYAGVILVFMMSYGFSKARFIWACLTGWINVLFYEIVAIWIIQTPGDVLLNNNFFFISANIIGMFICYSNELYARTNYYMDLKLEFAQKKTMDINQELEQRVSERTSNIKQTNERLQKEIEAHKKEKEERKQAEMRLQQAQKMEAIGTLAGGIAHDFNNILFPIMGHTEMLLEDIPDDSPYRESINEIYTGSLRARDLVHQILAFSRQEKNELKLMKIQPIIKEALKLIRSTIPTTISIHQNLQPNCGAVKADPTQIHQIVMNLATNAYHAMEENGGELKVILNEIELEKDDLITPDMEPGGYACLTISDTGIGINKTLLEKIFTPFFTTKENGKGTGMGLSVVHGIVRNMNGAVKVYSEPGIGTEIRVYLPVVKNASEDQLNGTKEPVLGGTERILLVDDEEAIITMEKLILERLGYKVTSRTSSLEALEAFRAGPNRFDLVITDMSMPKMPGNQLAVELIKMRRDIPVILCTGFSESITEEQLAAFGVAGFLLKPVISKDLAKKIREVLDK